MDIPTILYDGKSRWFSQIRFDGGVEPSYHFWYRKYRGNGKWGPRKQAVATIETFSSVKGYVEDFPITFHMIRRMKGDRGEFLAKPRDTLDRLLDEKGYSLCNPD